MSTYNNSSRRGNAGVRRTLVTSFPTYESGDYDTKKKVKMGFFRRKFMEWSKRAWDDSRDYSNGSLGIAVKAESTGVESEAQLNFKIYGAMGGHIMEFRRYDRKNDRYDNQLYIIPTSEDMGERVARIVNMEMMK